MGTCLCTRLEKIMNNYPMQLSLEKYAVTVSAEVSLGWSLFFKFVNAVALSVGISLPKNDLGS